jgi:hypothetical protein
MANEAAHQLAKLALGHVEVREWREVFPSCVQDIVNR